MKSYQMFMLFGELIDVPVIQTTVHGDMLLLKIKEILEFHEPIEQVHRVYVYKQTLNNEDDVSLLEPGIWVRVIGKLLKRDFEHNNQHIKIDEVIASDIAIYDEAGFAEPAIKHLMYDCLFKQTDIEKMSDGDNFSEDVLSYSNLISNAQ